MIRVLNGAKILVQEHDGLCHIGTLATQYEHAEPAHVSKVMGWGDFDGIRQWYRLPDAAWQFCYLPDTEGRLID